MNAYLEAMRLERWPRSTAIFFGIAAFFFLNEAHRNTFTTAELFLRLIASFLLTWGISTANYIINEIVDAPYDAHHPTKKNRPLVRGEIKKSPFLLMGVLLTVTCLGTAYAFFSFPFFLSLLGLLLAGFIYNIKPVRTKDIPFLDSISESANNPIRFFIGWYAFAPVTLFPPLSLLLCWWAFGNFLLVAKRLSEFRFLKDKAGDYRQSLRKYTKTSLLFGMAASTVFFIATYIWFTLANRLEIFFYLSPPVLFFFFLIFRKTLVEQEVMEEPERLLKHAGFAGFSLALLALFLLAALLDKVGY